MSSRICTNILLFNVKKSHNRTILTTCGRFGCRTESCGRQWRRSSEILCVDTMSQFHRASQPPLPSSLIHLCLLYKIWNQILKINLNTSVQGKYFWILFVWYYFNSWQRPTINSISILYEHTFQVRLELIHFVLPVIWASLLSRCTLFPPWMPKIPLLIHSFVKSLFVEMSQDLSVTRIFCFLHQETRNRLVPYGVMMK